MNGTRSILNVNGKSLRWCTLVQQERTKLESQQWKSKWAHGAGYGGYGAVMGSKNLVAVLARGTGPLPDVYDQHERSSETY